VNRPELIASIEVLCELARGRVLSSFQSYAIVREESPDFDHALDIASGARSNPRAIGEK